jgi:SP family sugar:H+ symporter-like MFS transporter
MSLVPP